MGDKVLIFLLLLTLSGTAAAQGFLDPYDRYEDYYEDYEDYEADCSTAIDESLSEVRYCLAEAATLDDARLCAGS